MIGSKMRTMIVASAMMLALNQAGAQSTVSINGLPAGSAVTGTENFAASQQNSSTGIYASAKISAAQILNYIISVTHTWTALQTFAVPPKYSTMLGFGSSVANPGTGFLESLLPVQTVTGASKIFATADLFMKTRRSNSGVAMTDTFPAASMSGIVNGTRIIVANTDPTASDTITAGIGTFMPNGTSTDTVGPGRDIAYEYDSATTQWRAAYNTRTALLSPNNLNDVASPSAALSNIGGAPLASPNFTGIPTAPTQTSGDASTKIATDAFVAGAVTASSQSTIPGGLINKFRDGTFDVWQRGTGAITLSTSASCSTTHASCMTADGWAAIVTGANATAARAASLGGGTLYGLQITGAASNTDVMIAQRIESYVAAPLAANVVTVQFEFSQSTGASVAPKISTCYASSADVFSTCTPDLSATSLTSCPSGATCLEAYTFTPSSNAKNGYQISIDCGALLAAQTCEISTADIRVTPGVAGGVNAAPPPAELRPIFAELPFCGRYYAAGFVRWDGSAASGTAFSVAVWYSVPMRSVGTLVQTNSTNIGFPATPGFGNATTIGFFSLRTASGSGSGQFSETWTVSSEL